MLSEAVGLVMPAFWPFYQGLYLMIAPESAFRKPTKPLEYKFEWSPKFLISYNFGIYIYALVSYLSYKYTFPDLSSPINWSYWIPVIIVRDVFITWIIYEPWHWFTYGSNNYVKKLSAQKFNKEMPEQEQWSRDRFWSTTGTVIAALHELLAIYIWSKGYASYYNDFWQFASYSIFWSLFATWWR
eukprot:183854_1